MEVVARPDENRTILRWGGLASIFGAELFLAVFVVVGVFVGAEPDAAGRR